MGVNYNPINTMDSLVFYVDAANPKSYAGTGSTWIDLINGNNVTLFNSPSYTNNTIQFRENLNGFPKYGVASVDYGIMKGSGKTTWSIETFFKFINSTSGNGNYGLFENVILGRQGCHGGIYTYGANTLQADIKTDQCWTGATSAPFGTITNGQSYHAVMTFNNGVTKTYLNGVYIGSSGTMNTDLYTMTYSSALFLGGIPGYTSNVDMHFAKAYTKELTAAEVIINFNACRSRGGI
jgi:hypothetical protein